MRKHLTEEKKDKILRFFEYFVIYSFLGFILETIYALIVGGVFESRKSFLYGPVCAIYGVGATILITLLERYKGNKLKLFFGGILVGSLVEYLISLIGELIFHVKWWDYSAMPFNINGRICIYFSIMWGFLAIILVRWVNPKIMKLVDKIPHKKQAWITGIFVVIMFIDWIISSIALEFFYARLVKEKKIDIQTKSEYVIQAYENEDVRNFVDSIWDDETMIKSFPNLRVTLVNGESVYVNTFFPEIKPYYFRVFTPRDFQFGEMMPPGGE